VTACGRVGVWACGRVGEFRRNVPPGGEPLYSVPQGLPIFFSTRRRPKIVLNRRLPETTARDVLPRGFARRLPIPPPADKSHVQPLAGAACLTVLCGPTPRRDKYSGLFGRDPKRLPSRGASPPLDLVELLLILPQCFSAS
jgi:hypothetical protein